MPRPAALLLCLALAAAAPLPQDGDAMEPMPVGILHRQPESYKPSLLAEHFWFLWN
jgi:hypothetical protein